MKQNMVLCVCFISFWCVLLSWDSWWWTRIVRTFVSSGEKAEEEAIPVFPIPVYSSLPKTWTPPSPTPIPGLQVSAYLVDICPFSPLVT